LFLIKRQVADKRGKRDRLDLIFGAPQSAKWRDSLSATRFAIGLLEAASVYPGNTKGGKYHCTIDLLFDWFWFGISCMTTDNFCFYLQNRLIQTGGQWYIDTAPFSIPWHTPQMKYRI